MKWRQVAYELGRLALAAVVVSLIMIVLDLALGF